MMMLIMAPIERNSRSKLDGYLFVHSHERREDFVSHLNY